MAFLFCVFLPLSTSDCKELSEIWQILCVLFLWWVRVKYGYFLNICEYKKMHGFRMA